ncbi:MAG: glycosyltransferase family 1 protein [Acidobacteriota bacterium]
MPDLLRMGWAATALSANVFFFPAVYSYFPLFRPVPSVVTFHDAIAEEHPDLVFPERRARLFWRMKTRLALATATRILTVSDSARLQISRLFGIPESAIAVATEGAAEIFGRRHDPLDVARALGKYGLPRDRPLFLYVGGISPHKNIDGLLRALARLQDATFHLAIVGDKDSDTFLSCYPAIAKLAQDLGLASRITFPGFVPDGDLALLYAGATALVFPSFSEGFGLPAVEAMASGLPVAASRAGSLPEVVKDAGLLFDPRDEGSIADAIARLLADAELRARLRRAGLARAAQYSWEPSAHAVVRLLEEIASA